MMIKIRIKIRMKSCFKRQTWVECGKGQNFPPQARKSSLISIAASPTECPESQYQRFRRLTYVIKIRSNPCLAVARAI